MMQQSPDTVCAGIYTLGCRVNQYESEALSEKLEEEGVKVRDFSEKNDIYIINTCTVTAESDRKSRQMIRRALSSNPEACIIVTGCMAEKERESLLKMEGVDIICGNASKLSAVQHALEIRRKGVKNAFPVMLEESMITPETGYEPMKIRCFGRTRAYVKIQDGCGGRCSYCIIPRVRGRSRSRPVTDITEEVRRIADSGCREVVLTGIETSDYEYGLISLAEQINDVSGIERIRFGSLDPSFMTEENVRNLMSIPKCMPHFHISIQHGSDRILRSMRRRYLSDSVYRCIESVRSMDSDAMITADLIAGFPGEEESDVEESARLIKHAELLHSHIFTYSKREGTPAAVMDGQIPEYEKNRRAEYLSSVQDEVKKKLLNERIGRKYEVLTETEKNGSLNGHSRNFIDISITKNENIGRNEIVSVMTDGIGKECLTGHVI